MEMEDFAHTSSLIWVRGDDLLLPCVFYSCFGYIFIFWVTLVGDLYILLVFYVLKIVFIYF